MLRGRFTLTEWALILLMPILLRFQIASSQTIEAKEIKSGVWEGQSVEYVSGQILFKLKSRTSVEGIRDLLRDNLAKIVRETDELGIGMLEIPDSLDLFQTIKWIQNHPLIEFAEPNLLAYESSTHPNDPYYAGTSPATYRYQWALYNIGQSPPGGTNDADIDAPEAWDIETGSSSVKIAILDSGIPMQDGNLSHPDLNDPNKIELGPDYVGDGNGVKDERGHGTHVAGIASAETNNSEGIAGVCWNSKLLIVQISNNQGETTHQRIYDGIKYAADHGARVINLSFGSTAGTNTLKSAVEYANSKDCLLVASAGNTEGGSVRYPAAYSTSYENVIAVSATDHYDIFSSYSAKGSQVNVAAPGGYGGTINSNDIYSTFPNYHFTIQDQYPEVTQTYGYYWGTSMAAPHVAGLAGLICSKDASLGLKPADVRTIIEQSADDKGATGRDDYYGWGRINAHNALRITTSGTLPGNEVWRGIITITGNVTVPSGVKLTILPGTTVQINSGKKLTVNGTLKAEGTSSQPITFDKSGSSSWWGLKFENGSQAGSCLLEYCTIKNASYGVYCNNYLAPPIKNCTISNCTVGI